MPQLTALIIDDNATNALVLQQLLSLEGVPAKTICSNRALKAQLDLLTGIGIVFVDLEMPVLDGYEVLTLLRAHPNFAGAKIVAYSVHVSELYASFDQGFDAFLGKPIGAEAFPDQLARILRGEKIAYVP